MCQVFSHFSSFLHHFELAKVATGSKRVNPSNAEAIFIQSTRRQIFENHINPVMLVFIESSHYVLSYEYPCARFFIHFSSFLPFLRHFVLANVATSSIRVNN